MSISNSMLLSAIRGLEDAVYFKDCRGRYASLPDNNSMRIDLLSSRVSELAKMIEDAMGGDIPDNIKKIMKYLDNTTDTDAFPTTVYGETEPKDIVDVGSNTDDKGKYTSVQQALQSLYDREGSASDGSTGITYDKSKDGYVKYMNDGVEPTSYTTNLSRYPNVFKYIYEELNYLFEHLFERENELDVYEDMTIGYN